MSLIITNRLTRNLRIVMFILAFMGIVIVIRRIVVMSGLTALSDPPGGLALDAGFTRHKAITLIHILPGLLFMILGPLQFMPRIRAKHIQFHRWSGRVFMTSAFITGLSAITLPVVKMPIGGLSEAAGSIFYGFFFLIALGKAWRHILRKQIPQHREWMIRAFATGLAVVTIRPIIASFFVFSTFQPQEFFGTAFWIGFTLHLIAAELYINHTRSVSQ